MMSALKGKSIKSRPLGYNPTPTCAALARLAGQTEPPPASCVRRARKFPRNLVPVEGKPTWIQAPDTAKGAHAGPESDAGMAQKLAHSIDATQLAQAPVARSSLDEVTMADVVPMALRISPDEHAGGGCGTDCG